MRAGVYSLPTGTWCASARTTRVSWGIATPLSGGMALERWATASHGCTSATRRRRWLRAERSTRELSLVFPVFVFLSRFFGLCWRCFSHGRVSTNSCVQLLNDLLWLQRGGCLFKDTADQRKGTLDPWAQEKMSTQKSSRKEENIAKPVRCLSLRVPLRKAIPLDKSVFLHGFSRIFYGHYLLWIHARASRRSVFYEESRVGGGGIMALYS